jgi:hypothetical protein
MNIGHIGTVLKGFPVTGFCFDVLALHTQDVPQVPVSCSAKQNKHDVGIGPSHSGRSPGSRKLFGKTKQA